MASGTEQGCLGAIAFFRQEGPPALGGDGTSAPKRRETMVYETVRQQLDYQQRLLWWLVVVVVMVVVFLLLLLAVRVIHALFSPFFPSKSSYFWERSLARSP